MKPFRLNYDIDEGWTTLSDHDSVKQFLKYRQARLQGKIKRAGPNYDLGQGLYSNLDKYHSVQDFLKGPHGSTLQDNNSIDFPIDEQINHYDQMVYPEESSYQPPQQMGSNHVSFFPSSFDNEDYSSYNASIPAGFDIGYTPLHDADGKGAETLDFSNDLDNVEVPDISEHTLQKLMDKYLTPAESELFGLPDGMDPADLDADKTTNVENPFHGTTDVGTQTYSDNWNI